MLVDAEMTMDELKQELTEYKARVAELEQRCASPSELAFQNVIDVSPVPYALINEEQNITYLNPAFIQTFGYDLSDIPTLNDWWPQAYPDTDYQLWITRTWEKHLLESKKTGKPFVPLELQIQCKDRSKRFVLANAAPLTESYLGNHLVIFYDITERKKYEDKLYEQESELIEIIDHLPSMIFLKEARSLRYVRFNAAGEKLTGISRADIIGKNDHDFFPKEQADFFTGRDRVVLASGKLEDIPDEPIDTPHGTRRLHTRKVSINDIDGNPKYLLGISDDITEQKAMESERRRLQRELQQAHKMESLGQLTGGIAHDFNNLLSIISGFTQLSIAYCEEYKYEKLLEYLNSIQAAEKRATSLVSQMLSFSRKDKVDLCALNIVPVIEQDIKMLRATLPSTLKIELDVELDLPHVMLNPTLLNQVLINLAINARDAMDASGVIYISLKLRKDMNAVSTVSHQAIIGDWVELAVKDTGCGIDTDTVENMFTPYFTTKPLGKGTGMGLSVIYGIMNNCNGHIIVESEPGFGSTFRMLFPPVLSTSETKCKPGIFKDSTVRGNGEKILVIDDEQSLGLLIGTILNELGYDADVLLDSTEALDKFLHQPDQYRLIITDQTMPDLTGMELVDKVRAVKPEQPVILCTGYSDKVNEKIAVDKKISYFTKPLDTALLIQEVSALIYK